jgi:hypothetical protein
VERGNLDSILINGANNKRYVAISIKTEILDLGVNEKMKREINAKSANISSTLVTGSASSMPNINMHPKGTAIIHPQMYMKQ